LRQIKGRLLLSEGEKATLAEIAQRLGRKALEELAAVAKPDTLPVWYRKLIGNKFDDREFANESVDRELMRKQNGWSCRWRKKTRAGVTIALWGP
jgi:hypothetical protein